MLKTLFFFAFRVNFTGVCISDIHTCVKVYIFCRLCRNCALIRPTSSSVGRALSWYCKGRSFNPHHDRAIFGADILSEQH